MRMTVLNSRTQLKKEPFGLLLCHSSFWNETDQILPIDVLRHQKDCVFDLERVKQLYDVRVLIEDFEDFDFVVDELFDFFEGHFLFEICFVQLIHVDGFDGDLVCACSLIRSSNCQAQFG